MKPKHEKTSKLIRNDHKISHLMDLSGIQTLKVPRILKRPLKNPELKPQGLCVNLCTFGSKCKNKGIRAP